VPCGVRDIRFCPLNVCGCFRSAEQSTEMFRSLRSVAMQLDQGLAEMEELDALLEDDEDSSAHDAPAMSGPANVEAEPTVRRPTCVHVSDKYADAWGACSCLHAGTDVRRGISVGWAVGDQGK
jgi:hypothetical protein